MALHTQEVLKNVARQAERFHCKLENDPAAVVTAKWNLTYGTKPTANTNGITGWADVDLGEHTKTIRLHLCNWSPCNCKWSAAKYGTLPVPEHCQLVLEPDVPALEDGVPSLATGGADVSSDPTTAHIEVVEMVPVFVPGPETSLPAALPSTLAVAEEPSFAIAEEPDEEMTSQPVLMQTSNGEDLVDTAAVEVTAPDRALLLPCDLTPAEGLGVHVPPDQSTLPPAGEVFETTAVHTSTVVDVEREAAVDGLGLMIQTSLCNDWI